MNKQQLVKQYDMSKIWQVDTAGLDMLDSDCPIESFKICKDTVCSA